MNQNAGPPAGPPELLHLSESVAILPVIHGSGQFAQTVRRWLLEFDFDCVAVPLPESFRDPVEEAILDLPLPSIVIQRPGMRFGTEELADFQEIGVEEDTSNDDEEILDSEPVSYVPVDPCQPVVMAIRAAMGEHVKRAYIDLETAPFLPFSTVMPDPFAVRQVSAARFAAAVLPSLPRPADRQTNERIVHMAWRLAQLRRKFKRVLCVTSVMHWPWIREAFTQISSEGSAMKHLTLPEHNPVQPAERFAIDPKTLMFLFGELPFITGLYERAREELEDDDDLQIDGVKELLIAARASYRSELKQFARRITPLHLSKCLQYIRNLSLMSRRMTPDLITIVTAAQQIMGDQYALHVAELANQYGYAGTTEEDSPLANLPMVRLGIDQIRFADGEVTESVNRLPGPPMIWRTLELKRKPSRPDTRRWKYQWNPYSQCSYPPEDERIENFRTRVFDRAKAIVGNDLARTEKFTT
ncbi:MAG: hypothetical protein AAGJ83_07690, partial [Planctomycetota bacterium]